jgi:hypothetical protein
LSIDQPDLKKWFIENVMQIDVTLNIITDSKGTENISFETGKSFTTSVFKITKTIKLIIFGRRINSIIDNRS